MRTMDGGSVGVNFADECRRNCHIMLPSIRRPDYLLILSIDGGGLSPFNQRAPEPPDPHTVVMLRKCSFAKTSEKKIPLRKCDENIFFYSKICFPFKNFAKI